MVPRLQIVVVGTLPMDTDHSAPTDVAPVVGVTNIHPQSAGLGADSTAISKAVDWGDFGNVDAMAPILNGNCDGGMCQDIVDEP